MLGCRLWAPRELRNFGLKNFELRVDCLDGVLDMLVSVVDVLDHGVDDVLAICSWCLHVRLRRVAVRCGLRAAAGFLLRSVDSQC